MRAGGRPSADGGQTLVFCFLRGRIGLPQKRIREAQSSSRNGGGGHLFDDDANSLWGSGRGPALLLHRPRIACAIASASAAPSGTTTGTAAASAATRAISHVFFLLGCGLSSMGWTLLKCRGTPIAPRAFSLHTLRTPFWKRNVSVRSFGSLSRGDKASKGTDGKRRLSYPPQRSSQCS